MLNDDNLYGLSRGIEKNAILFPMLKSIATKVPQLIKKVLTRGTIESTRSGLKSGVIGTALTVPVVGGVGFHQLTAGMPKAKPLSARAMEGL